MAGLGLEVDVPLNSGLVLEDDMAQCCGFKSEAVKAFRLKYF